MNCIFGLNLNPDGTLTFFSSINNISNKWNDGFSELRLSGKCVYDLQINSKTLTFENFYSKNNKKDMNLFSYSFLFKRNCDKGIYFRSELH